MGNMPYDSYDWDDIENYDPKDEKIFTCGEYVRDIVQILYSKEPLDRSHLEILIDELCDLLKVKLPDNFLNIERRKNVPMRDYFSNLDMKSLYITNKTI